MQLQGANFLESGHLFVLVRTTIHFIGETYEFTTLAGFIILVAYQTRRRSELIREF